MICSLLYYLVFGKKKGKMMIHKNVVRNKNNIRI